MNIEWFDGGLHNLMNHLEKIQNYFFLNQAVYVVSMVLAYYAHYTIFFLASAIGLIVSLYIYEENYSRPDVWTLDQVAILAVLLPGFFGWIGNNPLHHALAGMFFILGLLFYCVGIVTRRYGHHSNEKVREKWHLIMHLMSFLGHCTLIFGFLEEEEEA